MSLCTTYKDLGIDLQAYVRDVRERISMHPFNRLDELLPDQWKKRREAPEGIGPEERSREMMPARDA